MSEALVEEMLEYWRHLESFFGVKLTLHDHTGSFLLPEKVKLLPGTNVHQSPCCAFWYNSRERCQLHCNFEAAKKAAEGSPFVSTCFCGVTELVLPLYIGQIHAATIFAGMFRQKDFDLSVFPEIVVGIVHTLAPEVALSPDHLYCLAFYAIHKAGPFGRTVTPLVTMV